MRIVVLHSGYSSTTILVVKGSERLFIVNKGQINIVKVVAVITTVATLFFVGYSITGNIKYSEFVKVEAKVINTSFSTNTSTMSHTYYATFEYTYEGEIYTASVESVIPRYSIDTFEVIRCNPNNPKEIEDTFWKNGCIAWAIFFGVISISLIYGIFYYYKNKKKNRYVRYE